MTLAWKTVKPRDLDVAYQNCTTVVFDVGIISKNAFPYFIYVAGLRYVSRELYRAEIWIMGMVFFASIKVTDGESLLL